MFKKLQKKWGVNSIDLILILTTFALGGSLCGKMAQLFVSLIGLEKGVVWWIIYFVLVTVFWPICVLLISIPFGQFLFFKRYTKSIFSRISGRKKS